VKGGRKRTQPCWSSTCSLLWARRTNTMESISPIIIPMKPIGAPSSANPPRELDGPHGPTPPNFRIAHEDAKVAVLNKSTESIGLSSFIPSSGAQNPNGASPIITSREQTGKPKPCELARVLWQPPLPYPSPRPSRSCQNEERGKFPGACYPGWRSFLTYPGLQSGHPYGVSVWWRRER
jgi:hypothetical protein